MPLTIRLVLPLAAVGLLLAACSDDGGGETATDDQTSTSAPTSTDPATTSSDPETSSTTDTTTGDDGASSTTTTSEPTDDSADTSDPQTTSPDGTPTCSAVGVERPGPQPELPDAVAQQREAILSAALACDIDGLAALTGPSFTASFGGGEPAEVWTADEDFGTEPMRALVEILRLPATADDDGSGGMAYTWPPAFSYETWEEVPAADREALRVLYDDEDFEGFAQFGGYIGYRARITEDGTWTAFVAGD